MLFHFAGGTLGSGEHGVSADLNLSRKGDKVFAVADLTTPYGPLKLGACADAQTFQALYGLGLAAARKMAVQSATSGALEQARNVVSESEKQQAAERLLARLSMREPLALASMNVLQAGARAGNPKAMEALMRMKNVAANRRKPAPVVGAENLHQRIFSGDPKAINAARRLAIAARKGNHAAVRGLNLLKQVHDEKTSTGSMLSDALAQANQVMHPSAPSGMVAQQLAAMQAQLAAVQNAPLPAPTLKPGLVLSPAELLRQMTFNADGTFVTTSANLEILNALLAAYKKDKNTTFYALPRSVDQWLRNHGVIPHSMVGVFDVTPAMTQWFKYNGMVPRFAGNGRGGVSTGCHRASVGALPSGGVVPTSQLRNLLAAVHHARWSQDSRPPARAYG